MNETLTIVGDYTGVVAFCSVHRGSFFAMAVVSMLMEGAVLHAQVWCFHGNERDSIHTEEFHVYMI